MNRKDMFDKNWKQMGIAVIPNGNINYYDVLYVQNYQCNRGDSINKLLLEDSGADPYMKGIMSQTLSGLFFGK